MYRKRMGISFIIIRFGYSWKYQIMIRNKQLIISNNYVYMPDRCFRMLICGKSGCGKTNTVLHMFIKLLIFYDKLFLY